MTATFTHRVGEDLILLAAPRSFGRTLLRGDVSAITVKVYDLDDPSTVLHTQTYYTAAEPSTGDYTQAMFDSLQTDASWPYSTGGYSLWIRLEDSTYSLSDDAVYLVDAELTVAVGTPTFPDLTDGGVKIVQWVVDPKRVL
jgi:hypothetical protein